MFQKLEFNKSAIVFLRAALETQGCLWRLLSSLPLENGRVFAYLPNTVRRGDLLKFDWALHRLDDLQNQTVDWEYREKELEFLITYVHLPGRHVGIFRGTALPETYPPVDVVSPLMVMTYNSAAENVRVQSSKRRELYYLLDPSVHDDEDVRIVVESADRMPFMGALTSLPPGLPELPRCHSATTEELETLAIQTEHILVSAFDEDATLIWSRA